jgi:hypothetical protein
VRSQASHEYRKRKKCVRWVFVCLDDADTEGNIH